MRYTLEHLAPAVALGEPRLFVKYVEWLVELLAARAIPADDVRVSLDAMKSVLAERLASDASGHTTPILRDAIAAVASTAR